MIKVRFCTNRIKFIEDSIIQNLEDYSEDKNYEELKSEIQFLKLYFYLIQENGKIHIYESIKEIYQFQTKIKSYFSDLRVFLEIDDYGDEIINFCVEEE